MAKYEVKRSCGCVEEVSLIGPHRQREARLRMMRETKCLRCEAKEAREKVQEMGLPSLVGSPRQVDWAEVIRARCLSEVDAVRNEIEHMRSAGYVEAASRYADALDRILAVRRAKWWIERRRQNLWSLVRYDGVADLEGLRREVM